MKVTTLLVHENDQEAEVMHPIEELRYLILAVQREGLGDLLRRSARCS